VLSKKPTANPSGLFRIRAKMAYDGTNYAGFGKQPDQISIQGELEKAIKQIFGQSVKSIAAGRTDRGVHARGQWAHFDLPEKNWRKVKDARYSLNQVLPADIRILEIEKVSNDFDARYSALWRRYSYWIVDKHNHNDPLRRNYVHQYVHELDLAKLKKASKKLIGLHDFATYCKPRENSSTVRNLMQFDWQIVDGVYVAELKADAFCYGLVRNLLGAVLPAGAGLIAVDEPFDRLNKRKRSFTISQVPARGLILEEVAYPDPTKWASQVKITKKPRILPSA
jgi:tRNA pseudouridine38-40 synthase